MDCRTFCDRYKLLEDNSQNIPNEKKNETGKHGSAKNYETRQKHHDEQNWLYGTGLSEE